jgi:DNA-directed RNA polymerase subunit L
LVAPYVALDIELPVGNLNVSINLCATRAGGYEVLFQNQEHTLGNLLQTYLVERHIEGTEMPRVKYAGYKVPHPLRQEMVVVIIPEDGLESSARKAIANVCVYLKGYFAGLSSSWQSSFEPKTVGQVTAAAVPEPYTKATKAKTVKAVAEPVVTEPAVTAKPKTKRSTKA